jgi:hypothetical protein
MIMTRRNEILREHTCPSAAVTTTNPTLIGLGLYSERPKAKYLSNGKAVIMKVRERDCQ